MIILVMTVTGKGDNARYDIQKHQSDNEVLLASVYQDSGTNSVAWDIFSDETSAPG